MGAAPSGVYVTDVGLCTAQTRLRMKQLLWVDAAAASSQTNSLWISKGQQIEDSFFWLMISCNRVHRQRQAFDLVSGTAAARCITMHA
mmetsp:Transcript_22217/g.43217  ORF Transcript_22217/g.43217 Transcript_22217/m.43217 type:complete len:88 (-) Transcript_22217:109-372(-)